MNVREAIKVLADGGKVVDCTGGVWELDEHDCLWCCENPDTLLSLRNVAPFTLLVLATDEELVAEMERQQSYYTPDTSSYLLWGRAIDMLRARKVKP